MPLMPEDYVTTQRFVNAIHSDGSVESPNEESCAYAKRVAAFFALPEIKPTSILDVGCRTGYTLPVFKEAFPDARVVGLDIVPEFIEAAKQRGEAFVGDMHALPFGEGEFDLVFCTGSIEHAYDGDKACRELFRVARSAVFLSADCSPLEVFEDNPSHYTFKAGPMDWVRACDTPGWQLISLTMPQAGAADMLWVSPALWRFLQVPVED